MNNINYYDMSGGICQASTKTELGLNPKKIYWSDSKNIEIYCNKGIIRQKGNTLFLELPEEQSVTGMCEIETNNQYKLVITTSIGNIYIYSKSDDSITKLEKTITGIFPKFVPFLKGILVATESDEMFYIKNNSSYDIESCNLTDLEEKVVYPECITIYKGRVWCAKESVIYYSALGTYNDFKTANDAGYIKDFHTNTNDIVAMKTYKDYLAIYKKDQIYLLSGSSPTDFAIELFADKGTVAQNSIINVDNKQYFLSNEIYALEQVGELNQIRLGSSISQNITDEFQLFDTANLKNTVCIHYYNKNQIWCLFPYLDDNYYHSIWIYDYVVHAWYKRVLPQDVTSICIFNSNIYTADKNGKIYREDYGTSFDGNPIEFFWKSPFLSFGTILTRKLIDEFYFILDDLNDNNFNFSIYKDYDSQYEEDMETIYSTHISHLVWADDDSADDTVHSWYKDGNSPIWSITSDVIEKAEISGSNYSLQLCVSGNELAQNCAIIGLQFKDIYSDE